MNTYIPYLSVLKLGSYTRRDSNISQVMQQIEWNKCLGPFKRRVPKLLNLINAKIVPNTLWKIGLSSISLLIDMCILLLDADTVDYLQCIYHVHCLPPGCTYTFCQWVESMHFYKLVLHCQTAFSHFLISGGRTTNKKWEKVVWQREIIYWPLTTLSNS